MLGIFSGWLERKSGHSQVIISLWVGGVGSGGEIKFGGREREVLRHCHFDLIKNGIYV